MKRRKYQLGDFLVDPDKKKKKKKIIKDDKGNKAISLSDKFKSTEGAFNTKKNPNFVYEDLGENNIGISKQFIGGQRFTTSEGADPLAQEESFKNKGDRYDKYREEFQKQFAKGELNKARFKIDEEGNVVLKDGNIYLGQVLNVPYRLIDKDGQQAYQYNYKKATKPNQEVPPVKEMALGDWLGDNAGLIGTGLGAGIGLLVGNPMLGAQLGGAAGNMVQGGHERRELEEKQENQKRIFNKTNQAGREKLTVPTNGFYGAEGGIMPANAVAEESSSPIGDKGYKFIGASHEQGGIPMDLNNDGIDESEVEGDEVGNGLALYSNRLKPTKIFLNLIEDKGFKTKTKKTYAKHAEYFLKKKEKYEEMLEETFNPLQTRTATVMIDRVDDILDMLFIDQEMKKDKSI